MTVNDSIENMETSISVPGQVKREDDSISRRRKEMGARQASQVQCFVLLAPNQSMNSKLNGSYVFS